MWFWIEIIGTVLGLFYLWFEYRASIWLWPANIVMPAIYILVYFHGGFYADMGINVWYLGAGIYGWLVWLRGNARGGNGKTNMPITRTPRRQYLPLLLCSIVFFVAIVLILINFTDSTVPYGDGFTTALSIVALWMLARKYVEQWLVWMVVDIVCTGLYVYKGLYPTAGLYALYSVISVFGYLKWLKMMSDDKRGNKKISATDGNHNG